MSDKIYRTIAFGSTQHKYWLITVPQILKIFILDQHIIVLKKSNQISVNIVLGFSPIYIQKRTILLPNSTKNVNFLSYLYKTWRIYHNTIPNETNSIFYHTYFVYSIIPSSNFQLCTNLSRFYSRNPRTPTNHSVAIE